MKYETDYSKKTNITAHHTIVLLSSLIGLATFTCTGSPVKQVSMYLQEEIINGSAFKELLEIENGTKKEHFFVNEKPVSSKEYEEALLNAEKEQRKKARASQQAERLKIAETHYRGHAKIAQKELKTLLSQVTHELSKLDDERLKPFLSFSDNAIQSEDHLEKIEKLLIDHQKLIETTPESADIKKINSCKKELTALLSQVKETFMETVNNAINNADDTKLLKELLALV